MAGIILCSIEDSDYIARKMDINSYMLFGPIFFASIGLKTDLRDFSVSILFFSIGFTIVALITKIIGCGLIAHFLKFDWHDSLKVGVGMMTRGEVALIVSQKGLSVGLISPVYFSSVILLILTSSVSTPIILKALYSKTNSSADNPGRAMLGFDSDQNDYGTDVSFDSEFTPAESNVAVQVDDIEYTTFDDEGSDSSF